MTIQYSPANAPRIERHGPGPVIAAEALAASRQSRKAVGGDMSALAELIADRDARAPGPGMRARRRATGRLDSLPTRHLRRHLARAVRVPGRSRVRRLELVCGERGSQEDGTCRRTPGCSGTSWWSISRLINSWTGPARWWWPRDRSGTGGSTFRRKTLATSGRYRLFRSPSCTMLHRRLAMRLMRCQRARL